MAQDFERNIANNVGTSASTIFTADSDDAVVGINIANVTSSQIKQLIKRAFPSITYGASNSTIQNISVSSNVSNQVSQVIMIRSFSECSST